jgi:hypothetical protein
LGNYAWGFIAMSLRLYSLAEASQLLSPDGNITARSLRTEARAGRLQLVRVAGKDFVTYAALNAMITAATVPSSRVPRCPVADCPPDFISVAPEVIAEPSGSFSTERVNLAREQALMSAKKLKRPSKPISPNTTDHRGVLTDLTNSSSRK